MITPITTEGYKLFLEGQIALAEVEHNGMCIDTVYLDNKIEETDKRIRELSAGLRKDKDCRQVFKAWKKKYGEKTNLGSREQLGSILFDVLKIEGGSSTGAAKARWRTDKDALEDMDLPFVHKFLEVEKLKKANTTYLKGIRREVDSKGFLHPSFNLNLVATFRSSSSSPNTQNWPIRDPEMAAIIRPCMKPRHKDRQIGEKDLSGAEVRTAACYCKDKALITYICNKNTDMHRDTAADAFILKKKQVSKNIRYVAKNKCVFPMFYGSWYFDCAKNMWISIDRMQLTTEDGIPLKKHLQSKGINSLGDLNPNTEPVPGTFIHHMKKVEHTFWKVRFKQYDQWKWDIWNKYCETGYIDTLTGFRCSAIMDRKQATNYSIQGSAFHLILWSLIKIQKQMKKYKMRTKIIGQIHDSLLVDIGKKELKDFHEISEKVMTQDLLKHWKWICVPIEAELEVAAAGKSWHEKHKIEF